MNKNTEIIVFEHCGSGQAKIKGIQHHGTGMVITRVFNIDAPLPSFIDEPEEYIDQDFTADLVLCFIKQPDLVHFLATLCQQKNIPMIASGVKSCSKALTPFTCCGLGRHKNLGNYGQQFGLPELQVNSSDGIITEVTVLRGASCGATWEASKTIIGLPHEQALPTFAREVQYLCVADPSAFDPITGKSSLHYAGHVHKAALKKGLGIDEYS